jgi:UDP-3-O-[3-hydroxymyristoyl] glucosamine N-acyltransferase
MTKENSSKSVKELAKVIGGIVRGDESAQITGIANLSTAEHGDIAFVEDKTAVEPAVNSRASCLIVPIGFELDQRTTIEVQKPKLAFSFAAAVLRPRKQRPPEIDRTSIVDATAKVEDSVFVGPFVRIGAATIGANTQIIASGFIGDGVSIGDDCVIHPGVVIYDGVTIGNRVIIHAGTVIGADGFGYVRGPDGYVKFPQVGTVVIEDDVEIGANSCIDRAALGVTRIGRGTKIDNMVQIAHNVDIGERVVIAAQTGISGSTVIEDDAVIGGQVGMGDHARVQSGAIIGSQAGVLPGKIVRPGVWWGTPVQRLDDYKRLNAHVNKLPKLREEVRELRRELDELKGKLKD